jgi:sortase A
MVSALRRCRRILSRFLLPGLAGLLALFGAWQLGQAGWIHAKAELATVLIERAWDNVRGGDAEARPWPWADTWPVARLQVPRLDVDLFVLAGASGRTIAFGPGHMGGTALPGGVGTSVIVGHRDTHFRFLSELNLGDRLTVTDANGRRHAYRVGDTRIVDSRTTRLRLGAEPALVLMTCYPFDAVMPGGPLRYLVFADEVAQ